MVDFLLLETGDYLLLETGDKLILEDGTPSVPAVTAGTDTSISHVTLDAGVDLRRKDNQRHVEKLRLSMEVAFKATSYKKQKLLIPFECVTKSVDTLNIPLTLIRGNPPIHMPINTSAYVSQKFVLPVTGEKSYSKAMLKGIDTQKKLAKIDTLKEMLRELDEQ